MDVGHSAGAGPVKAGVGLVWVHAIVYLLIAVACYLMPRAVFGETAWLPMAGLAGSLFGSALVALAIVLIACARSGQMPYVKVALISALVLDVQVPILLGVFPASLEHFDVALGLPWFLVPVGFVVISGATAYRVSTLRA